LDSLEINVNKNAQQIHQDQEASLTDVYSLFVYAIRTQITRDYYLRRLRTFLDFIKLLPNTKIEDRCNHFAGHQDLICTSNQ
jgi:hypothetical protein